MMRKTLLSLAALMQMLPLPSTGADLAGSVNPFIGTVIGSGNTYPGAQVPLGMISWSPQTEHFGGSPGGYHYREQRINGFGLTHLSGVGCNVTCELPFLPCTGELALSPAVYRNAYSSGFSHTNETASPGYYAVRLDRWDTRFEASVTERAGLAYIDFPATNQAHILLNPCADGVGLKAGAIQLDPETRTLSGWAASGSFCGSKECDYKVYFSARFDRPFAAFGAWDAERKSPGSTRVEGAAPAAYVTFDCGAHQRVRLKVAISFVSAANARLNLDQEIPGWSLAAVRKSARAAWNAHLERIQVSGGSAQDRSIFYTALYHSLLLPSVFEDVNGQYIGMDNRIHATAPGHHFLATFSGWDTYRTQAPLWGWLFPEIAGDFCSSLLAMSRQTQFSGGGGLPLWSLYNDETRIMAGYPAAPYIASAHAFGATNFDVRALRAVMVDSGRNERWCGRNMNVTWEHLAEYDRLGYCAADKIYACAKTVEYSLADFAIARMCLDTGDTENYRYFHRRSQGVFSLFNPERGYMQRKTRAGAWVEPFDPYSGEGFMEGNSAHYSWTVAHSLNKTVALTGGRETAEARLDSLTSQTATGYDYQSRYYEAGNEPCFGIIPVYNWLGRPWKAQEKMRSVMLRHFRNEPDGIPGDDDSGAMSAWYVFAALGLYPEIPGVGGFAVLSPLFPRAEVRLPNGKRLILRAHGASRTTPFIQAMKVNGQPSSKLWLPVSALRRGGTLDYVLGSEPSQAWGAAAADAPPSFESETP
jgi:predicted alpha-1,2-mannosidase